MRQIIVIVWVGQEAEKCLKMYELLEEEKEEGENFPSAPANTPVSSDSEDSDPEWCEWAMSLCADGTDLLEENEYLKAVGAFTRALKLFPAGCTRSIKMNLELVQEMCVLRSELLCHRSAALLAINKHAKAHVDAVACTSNFPQHKEGYWCQYKALQALGRYEVVQQVRQIVVIVWVGQEAEKAYNAGAALLEGNISNFIVSPLFSWFMLYIFLGASLIWLVK